MEYKITHHAGAHRAGRNPAAAAPPDALPRLLERLGPRREGVSFRMVGDQIHAKYAGEPPVSMTRDERVMMGRRAVLDLVLAACERAPDLTGDWFAVSEVTGRDQLR